MRRYFVRRYEMISFDEVGEMLDDITDELPEAFFKDLNGGVYLLPEVKRHPESRRGNPLFILGEYHSRRDLGKFIYMYYGSFMRVYPHLPPDRLREALRRVLLHEFTHHVEFLAGERGLEIKDKQDMERYRQM